VQLMVKSERSIGLLVDQINKLIDIKEVKVDNSETQQCCA
jgi:acetolactate synthase II small subunit